MHTTAAVVKLCTSLVNAGGTPPIAIVVDSKTFDALVAQSASEHPGRDISDVKYVFQQYEVKLKVENR